MGVHTRVYLHVWEHIHAYARVGTCACVCAHMSLCVHVGLPVYVHECVCMCRQQGMCKCACMYVCTRACACVHPCACVGVWECVSLHMHVHGHVCAHVHVCLCVCMYVHVHTRVGVCRHARVHVCASYPHGLPAAPLACAPGQTHTPAARDRLELAALMRGPKHTPVRPRGRCVQSCLGAKSGPAPCASGAGGRAPSPHLPGAGPSRARAGHSWGPCHPRALPAAPSSRCPVTGCCASPGALCSDTAPLAPKLGTGLWAPGDSSLARQMAPKCHRHGVVMPHALQGSRWLLPPQPPRCQTGPVVVIVGSFVPLCPAALSTPTPSEPRGGIGASLGAPLPPPGSAGSGASGVMPVCSQLSRV